MRRALFIHTFVQVLAAGEAGDAVPLPPEQAAALDSAVLAAYQAKGITTDARTWRRPAPLLGDLAHALAESGRVGIAKYVMRQRQHLAGLLTVDGRLVVSTMRFQTWP